MRLDSPILFGNSEDLYVNNAIEIHKETYEDFNDAMLYSFYCKIAQEGKFSKFEDEEKKTAVFIDTRKEKVFITKITDFSKY
jgi:hypothetical protein